jgi:chemotaxis protein histidine kinase CheA
MKTSFWKAAGLLKALVPLAIALVFTGCDDVLTQLKDELKPGQQTKQEKLDFSLVLENIEPEARYLAIIYGTDGAPVAGAEGAPLADDSVVFAFLVLPGEYGLKVTEKAGAVKTAKTDSVVFVDGLFKVVIGWDGLLEADAAEEPVEETDTEAEVVADEPLAVEDTDTEEEAVAEEPEAVEETDTEEEEVAEEPEAVEETDTEEEAVAEEPEAVEETDTEEEAVAEEPRDEPKEEPKDEPKADEPKDEPKADEPKEEPSDEPKADEPKEEPKDEPKADEPKEEPSDEPKADEPKADEPVEPVYGIDLNQTGTHIFPDAILGYGAQAAKVVTITNTGNQPTGALTLALTGANASAFWLNFYPQSTVPSLQVHSVGYFTVAPKFGLSVGVHTATVTVSGANGISRSVGVSFRVETGSERATLH